MIFTKLVVNNFGPYKGEHLFDLKPEMDGVNTKPVILFGGLNGSGKTKLLEAIKIVLYGSAVLGPRPPVSPHPCPSYTKPRLQDDF